MAMVPPNNRYNCLVFHIWSARPPNSGKPLKLLDTNLDRKLIGGPRGKLVMDGENASRYLRSVKNEVMGNPEPSFYVTCEGHMKKVQRLNGGR